MKKPLLAVAIAVLHFCCSVTFALDPIGSPAGTLKRGQFGIGADYSFSDVDFKANGRSTLTTYNVNSGDIIGIQSQKQSLSLDGVEVHKVYANLGYGITDNLEAFLRLGAADAEWKNDGDTHFSFGLRTGVTLYQKGVLQLNALAQYSWAESDFDSLPLTTVVGGISYPMLMWGRLNMQELQIALGPTYELSKGISLYGGGFFHFMDGKLDLKGGTSTTGIPMIGYDLDSSYDIDQASELGTYIGAKIDATKNISYSIEYQHTASADAIALRLIWKF
ncbi:MAG: outer membrane beta-barrel protein [Planctomycetota bacterium]